ncbi:MAG: hypothetical protein R6V55_12245 [Desulfovermiculus sp.]
MFRYALIIVGALVLGVYILVLAARGSISGRFRTISLILLCLFFLLAGAGLYTTQTRYSVQSVQEEYASRKQEILDRLSRLYADQEYTQARKLAQKYQQINDPRVDSWYRKAREAELLQRIKDLPEIKYKQRLNIWKELYDLSGKQSYAANLEQVKDMWRTFQESLLTERIDNLPDKALAQKALGYALLTRLNPERVLYKQRHRTYRQQIEEKIEASSWSNRCSSRNMEFCRYVGYRVESVQGQPRIEVQSSEICGVSWRPRGTLITRDGRTAPEDGSYYMIHDWKNDLIVLINTGYVQAVHPFPEISPQLLDN